jgi:ArsR family transcriptional regulator, arsenate/arsenite/antimonite-responsive transcriptional repressor / arsenate reductase (thioredoxin)
MPGNAVEVSPSRFLQLIADPQRWRLLGELARSDRRVGELSELVDKPQSLVSYHLGELRAAGLITARRSAADRRDSYYRVDLARCRDLFVDAGAALHPGVRLGLLPAAPTTTGQTRKPRVLFLCTGNSARSQIAEALLEHRSSHTIAAHSAGSHPKSLHPNAVRVMAERGIDISGRLTKHLSRFARTRFDRVITLCDKVKEICPEFPGQPTTAHWSMADPANEGDSDDATYPTFVHTADEIEIRVGLLIAQITTQPRDERSEHAHR